MKLTGKVFKYGANVDTDAIIPARYLNVSEPALLAEHCMEDIDLEFVKNVKPGDIIVATTNFGCGSSREHAPLAIKTSGISAVIAKSFARIFFRNAINLGLPAVVAPDAGGCTAGDELEIDLVAGEIRNLTRNTTCPAAPLDARAAELLAAGGLIPYLKGRYAAEGGLHA